VLLVPAMLVRNDLKQYTADACFALLTLAITARTEGAWSRRALVALSIAVWGGMFFSHTVALVGVAAFAALCASHTIPAEEIASRTTFVAGHAAPDDGIVVNSSGSWGFAFYWPVGLPSRRAATVPPDYQAYFPDQPRIVVARNRTAAGVEAALDEALARTRQRAGTRIWLVRTHVIGPEQEAWNAALRRKGLTATPIDDDGLAILQLR
jgi:hypothetical protein